MPALRFTPPPQLQTSLVLVKTAEGLPYPQVRYKYLMKLIYLKNAFTFSECMLIPAARMFSKVDWI